MYFELSFGPVRDMKATLGFDQKGQSESYEGYVLFNDIQHAHAAWAIPVHSIGNVGFKVLRSHAFCIQVTIFRKFCVISVHIFTFFDQKTGKRSSFRKPLKISKNL